ncbi:MAG: chemotaxis protein CheX [Desulfarculales bacterium]|jgi:chemotaxis protein CheX|nr:chemotaxis protein CheX [Desulfarculales bacterium]
MNKISYVNACINAFIRSAVTVLKTMAFTEAKPGKPYNKTDHAGGGDVSGIIGMTGPSDGSMSISFTRECILNIVSSMFGEQMGEINEEVEDAVGEITNMICGDARRQLEEKGITIKGAIPTVITGPGHVVKHITNNPVIAIPFRTERGTFALEISLEL